ncbi:MAG: diacylglycerol kinase [Deltaproteobacteria bacterium]|nr:diacylglycerol kinase [Deltaproteobacteria bacterium]
MSIDQQKKSGIIRIIRAFFYSIEGFKSAFVSEAAFRQELLLFIILLPAAIFLPVTVIEKLILIACLFVVLIVELLNSAVESTIDLITQEFHPLAKKAKDIASAAVLLSLIMTLVIWGVVIYRLLFR